MLLQLMSGSLFSYGVLIRLCYFRTGFLDSSEVANTLRECLKMKKFDHPHVMGILGICLAGQTPYIVLPFMANGSLHSYLRKYRPQLLVSEGGDIDLVSWSHCGTSSS